MFFCTVIVIIGIIDHNMTRRIIKSTTSSKNLFSKTSTTWPSPPTKNKTKPPGGAWYLDRGFSGGQSPPIFFERGGNVDGQCAQGTFSATLGWEIWRFGDGSDVGKVRCLWVSQMQNVWPIYLHLGSFGGKCR